MAPISFFYQNVRGLRTKTGVFYRNICLSYYDVVCLTETWLTEGISNGELFDGRYIVWRRDRDYTNTKQRNGGGVLIAVKRELVAEECVNWRSSAEDLWVTLTLKNKKPHINYKLHICVVYICTQKGGNSLNTQLDNFSNNLVDIILNHPSDKFILLGDFNLPNIDWQFANEDLHLSPSNIQGPVQTSLFDNFNLCNLMQYNSHINVNDRILDLILSNDHVSVSCCDSPLVPEDSHHKALCVSADFVEIHSLLTKPYFKFIYNLADYSSIIHELNEVDWLYEFNNRSLEDAVSYFYDTIYKLRDKHIPSKTVIPRNKYPPWYKTPLIKMLKEKSKYHSKYKKYRHASDFQAFTLLRQRIKDLEKSLFNDYITKIEQGFLKNPKAFWSYIKAKKCSNAYPSILKFGNRSSGEGEDVCNMFGEYFHSNFLQGCHIIDLNALAQEREVEMSSGASDLCTIEILEEEVLKLLKGVDLNKSPGPDHIPPIFIYKCAESLVTPITILFKKSLNIGKMPKIWKSAFITPIHKKGPKDMVENYRPISKLCILAKIFEKIVYRQVYAAIRQNFSEQQHGFLKGRSTTTNLVLLSDYLTKCMAQRSQVDVIYTDYSKAFDRLDHVMLMRKLLAIGIRGNLYRWFSSYVEDRCQTVVLNGYSSRARSVPSGIPQGSLLGPLLFNIFVNDIHHCFHHSKVLLYADDMKIFYNITSTGDAERLQEDLNRFEAYCALNKLELNTTKCYVCSFTRKPRPLTFNYSLSGTVLSRVEKIKDLGVIFDNKLIFDEHINAIVNKASKALGFIIRTSSEFKQIKTIKILYCAFVRSHLEYASQVWNPTYGIYINRIENIQKKFLRYVQFRSRTYLDSYTLRCRKFHMLPLLERRKIADLSFLLNICNGALDCPDLLSNVGLYTPSVRLRKPNLLYVPLAACRYRRNSYFIRVFRTFNEVCREVDVDLFHTSAFRLRGRLSDLFFGCRWTSC